MSGTINVGYGGISAAVGYSSDRGWPTSFSGDSSQIPTNVSGYIRDAGV